MVIKEISTFGEILEVFESEDLTPDLVATSDYFTLRYGNNVEKKCFAFCVGGALIGTAIVRIRRIFTIKIGIVNDSICFNPTTDLAQIQQAMDLLRRELNRSRIMICFWRTTGLGKINRGFLSIRISAPSIKTGLIDLQQTEPGLLSNCKGKWRNTLRKSERFGYPVTIGQTKYDWSQFIESYEQFQLAKGFKGIDSDFLMRLSDLKSNGALVPMLYRVQGSDADAYLLAIRAYGKCTYCVGITNDMARKHHLNSLLLWRSIVEAKRAGCKIYDLGGITPKTPDGIRKFKLGTNPRMLNSDGDFVSIL